MSNYRYKDLDIFLSSHPVTGDVVVKTDVDAIKASVVNLVQLNPGDKPFHPEIASGVRKLLFEPSSVVTALRMEQEISRLIRTYEPRINLQRVTIQLDNNNQTFIVGIYFNIKNRPELLSFSFGLERIR